MEIHRHAVFCSLTAFFVCHLLFFTPEVECQYTPKTFFKGQLNQARAIASASTVSKDRYPNADVVCIDQHYWVAYEPDGTSNQWDEKYVKILSAGGKRQYRRISSLFASQYRSTEIMLVEIIKPDGSVNTIDVAKNSQIAVDSSQMGMNIYDPNQKYLTLNIPHLGIGDIVHYIIKDTHFKARVPNTWSHQINFETYNPIARKEVTIFAPKNLELKKIAIRSEIPGALSYAKREVGDHIIYNWTAKGIPMAFPEKDMPPLHTQTQRLLVSTIDGWEAISRWYWNLAAPQINAISPDLSTTVYEITEHLTDPRHRIEAIFKWVSQQIRYLGLTTEKTSPGYEPHPVKMTFERKAGVCRDKAALLTAMLRIAGFEAYPVLIHTKQKMDWDVPQPFFNHAITAVRETDGSYLLMDPTDETTRFLLPAYLNDKSYLIATPEGETLRTTPIEPADKHMLTIDTTGELDAKGHLSARTSIQFNGINDNLYRDLLAGKSYSEMRAYFEVVINKYSFCAQIADIEITPANLMDTSIPLKINLRLESDVMEDIKNGTAMIKPPFIGNNFGWVNFLVERFGLERRKYPLITGDACGIRENFKIKMSPNLVSDIVLPEYSIINDDGTTWQRRISIDGNVLKGEKIFKLKLTEYNPGQYIALRKNLSHIEFNTKKYLIVNRAETDVELDDWLHGIKPDALVLNEINEYELADRYNWTESNYLKLKILTYAGKKRYSDLIIDYNPIWEKVRIEFARVLTRSGDVFDINSDEINIMDANWVEKAPRYSAGKVLALNFPGLDIGSIIEFKIIKSKRNHPFFTIDGSLHGSGHPFYKNSGKFRYHEPILRKTLKIKYPQNMDLKIEKYDSGTENLYAAVNHGKHHIQERRLQRDDYNLIEFSGSKIPPAAREGSLPPWYSFNPTVFVSSADLVDYARHITEKLMPKVTTSAIIQSVSAAIIEGRHGPHAKIQSIRDFTDRNIAYITIPYGKIPIQDISPAEITLTQGYGHNIDHAVLLFALLKAAGFNPEFILSTGTSTIRTLWQPLVSTPSYNWFDAVLVRVKTDEGYVYLNDTNQYSMLGMTASDKYPGLVLETSQIDTIESISEEYQNKLRRQYDISLNADGSAVIKVAKTYYGHQYANFRKLNTALTPETKRRYLLGLAAELSQSAVPIGEYVSNHAQYPGTETYAVKVDNFLVDQGGYRYINLPGLYSSIYGAYKNHRVNPFYYNAFDHDYVRVNLNFKAIGKQIVLAPPKTTCLKINGAGNVIINAGPVTEGAGLNGDRKNEGFYIEQKIALRPFMLSPDEYALARKNHEIMAHPSMHKILFN